VRWPRRGKPFVDGYLAALLAQASHLISADFHRVARQAGVPVAEWRILASLAGGQPLPVGRLAQIVIAPQPTVTRQLDRLVAKGLVERVAHETDRRLALVRTTPAGEALATTPGAPGARARKARAGALRTRPRAALKEMLREMIDAHDGSGAAVTAPARPGKPPRARG
jgi:DNA-binding MarR family transcriptional regulator